MGLAWVVVPKKRRNIVFWQHGRQRKPRWRNEVGKLYKRWVLRKLFTNLWEQNKRSFEILSKNCWPLPRASFSNQNCHSPVSNLSNIYWNMKTCRNFAKCNLRKSLEIIGVCQIFTFSGWVSILMKIRIFLARNVKASLLESSLLSHKYSFQSRGNLLRKELTKYPYLLFAREWLYIWTTIHLLQWQQIPFKRWICYLFLGGVFGNLVRISFNLVLPRNLFLSETLEKITFNPGLSGKLLLILENELGTSPPSSSPELQRQGTRCWWSDPDILSCKRQVFQE